MRKLTYYIATSLDGFVSRQDGVIDDFSFEGEHVQDLLTRFPETIPTHLRPQIKVAEENRNFDTVLMGRGTYELGLSFGISSPYQHLRQYVFTTTWDVSPHDDVALVKYEAINVVRQLKAEEGLGIWLCGGPLLASALLDEIDEIIRKVNPFVIGAGKSLFAGEFPKRTVQLVSRSGYDNGFALVHYKLDHRES